MDRLDCMNQPMVHDVVRVRQQRIGAGIEEDDSSWDGAADYKLVVLLLTSCSGIAGK